MAESGWAETVMMSTLRNFTVPVAVVLVALATADQSLGQAMISYGHGVAKAAGAGAAVGAGVGGVLTGLGNPLSRAAGRSRGGVARGRAATSRRVVPTRRSGDISWDISEDEGFGVPAPVGLVGGVQATGIDGDGWQPPLMEPSENLAVLAVQWGGVETPQESALAPSPTSVRASTPSAPAGEPGAPAEEPGIEEAEELEVEEGPTDEELPIVIRGGISADGSRAAGGGAGGGGAVGPTIPEWVEPGITVEELIARLGEPHLAFRGVAGKGYSDQYVFELPEGGELVVYALDGVVAHMEVV